MNHQALHRGFTLIELLLAMAIAAVLMIGLLAVIALTARDRLRMQSADIATAADPDGLLRIITEDLTSGRIAKPLESGQGIVIDGFCAIDRSTHMRTARPVEVKYQIEQLRPETPPFLVRRQRYLDERVPTKPWNEVIADGVSDLSIATATTPAEIQAMKEQHANIGELNRQVQLTLAFVDPKRPEINQMIILH